MPGPPKIPPGPLSRGDAEQLTRYLAELARLRAGHAASGGAAKVSQDAAGLRISAHVPPRIPVKILCGSNPYAGIEQLPTAGGGYTNRPNGLTFAPGSLPLYERNAYASVPAGAIVLAWSEYMDATAGRNYVFDWTPRVGDAPAACASSTTQTTTTTSCGGTCLWTCSAGAWGLTTNSCTGGCQCNAPTYCCGTCPVSGTETTVTYCVPSCATVCGPPNCNPTTTGTTTTGTGTTTTTTLPGCQSGCTGCSFECGSDQTWHLVSNGCGGPLCSCSFSCGDLVAGGANVSCNGTLYAGLPPVPCTPCQGASVPCCPVATTTTPPPCGGWCDWIANGMQWSLVAAQCAVGAGGCSCAYPMGPAPNCSQFTRTYCVGACPSGTTTTGTGTTTTCRPATTPPPPGSCTGSCRWVCNAGAWSVLCTNCPPGCVCTDQPPMSCSGSQTFEMPCGSTTTSSTTSTSTSSTSSTSTTTTTTCPGTCTFTCSGGVWQLNNNGCTGTACYCIAPGSFCTAGQTGLTACNQTTTTTATTTTSTTTCTTTTQAACGAGTCLYTAQNTGGGQLGPCGPFFLNSSNCTAGCTCPAPPPSCILAQCNSLGTSVSVACIATTSSTTTTTTTTSACSGTCQWQCNCTIGCAWIYFGTNTCSSGCSRSNPCATTPSPGACTPLQNGNITNIGCNT